MSFDIFEYTNKGGRSYNEDSIDYITAGDSGIFVVADGLGGHQYGDKASGCVCDSLINGWNGSFGGSTTEWLKERIALANTNVLALQKEMNAILKSTVVVLAIDNNVANWANVGDSRLYFFRDGRIADYTNDHSVAFKKYRAGEITREQIAVDEDQSSLLKSVGSEDRSEPEIYDRNIMLEPGDAFLLCSDGVWEYLMDEEIAIDLLKSDNSKEWAELLLTRLMGRIDGTNDNLSLLAIRI